MTKTGARILCLGHLCLDVAARLPRWANPDDKVEATELRIGGGGPAANAAVALARLGHRVTLAASVGDGPLARGLIAELESEGIDCGPCRFTGGAESSLAQIRVVRDQRSVVWRRAPLDPLSAAVPVWEEWVGACDLLYLDGHELAAAVSATAVARRKGIDVVADLGTLRDGTREILPGLSVAVVTPRFARALGARDVAGAMEALTHHTSHARWRGVTLGRMGSVLFDGDLAQFIPARTVEVVDSTGAGDAFHAGLAHGWWRGWGAHESFRCASALAAGCCRSLGGRDGLAPGEEALLQWNRELPEGETRDPNELQLPRE